MKHAISLLAVSLLALTASGAPPEPASDSKWETIPHLSDEFDGETLDRQKWDPQHPFWEGRDSFFTPGNVSVSDGSLHLVSSLKNPKDKVKRKNVTSAIIASKKANCGPGYYEARIKASDLSMTTAFWFQGTYSEIDVIENLGRPSNEDSKWVENTMMMNTHYYPDGWDNDIDTPVKWEMPVKAREDFQVFGVWWREDNSIWFYYNDQKVANVSPGGAFGEGMYMYFDTEVFHWHGWPTKESLLDPERNVVLVDWVRAWKLEKR